MNYREEFFKWVNKQPVYQVMSLEGKEKSLAIVNCWLNNQNAYFHYARACGKDFVIRCAVDFCWKIKNDKIKVLEKALDDALKNK